jgi:histidinol phosphatase-like PHP family hydrolase
MEYLKILERRGVLFVFRSGAGAVKTAHGSFFRSGRVGLQDITVLINGKYVALEIKAEKGRQSRTQKEIEKLVKKHGGYYYIVKDLMDVDGVLRDVDRLHKK